MKNYIKQSLTLTGLVVGILLILYFIPNRVISGLGLREIDILSLVRPRPPEALVGDTAEVQPLVQPPPEVKIPCKEGMVCFEDYSPKGTGMNAFFKALSSRKKNIRIAFFGDSYIEGDIFCSDFRALLQDTLGGAGVGMMGATSITAGFRTTVKHKFSGWNTSSLVDPGKKDHSKEGIMGMSFVPANNARVEYTGVNKPHLDTFNRASIIYRLPEGEAAVSYRINDKKSENLVLKASNRVQKYDIDDTIGRIQFNFQANENLRVFGISLQNKEGVSVDNFSLRGTPGTALRYINANTLRQTDSLLGYDLVVLQYGLNVMSANVTKYTSYGKNMVETVEYVKKCFPNSSILLLSVGDRSMKKQGSYLTMPGVAGMLACQQSVCAQTGIVFWNLFDAMGGEGSMVKFVTSKPPKANKDYTHLNFAGGKYLANILYETLVFERTRYEAKRKRR
ncbi:MAG: hypothetical protein LBC98_05460 [Prevotellaceae bacterium]|jgi:hypothetical protein|nr:hypothetical protein [Prevotellaceae bacterium]